jgi:hypothetical protein
MHNIFLLINRLIKSIGLRCLVYNAFPLILKMQGRRWEVKDVSNCKVYIASALIRTDCHLHAFLTSALGGCEWSPSRSSRFKPQKKSVWCLLASRWGWSDIWLITWWQWSKSLITGANWTSTLQSVAVIFLNALFLSVLNIRHGFDWSGFRHKICDVNNFIFRSYVVLPKLTFRTVIVVEIYLNLFFNMSDTVQVWL